MPDHCPYEIGGIVPDDAERKEVVLEYFRRLNEGNVDRVLELFSPDAVIEDPVGQEPRKDREAIREYYQVTMEQANCQVTVGKPSGAVDGRSVALPVSGNLIALQDPENRRVTIDCIDVLQIGEECLIEELRVFWGMTDFSF